MRTVIEGIILQDPGREQDQDVLGLRDTGIENLLKLEYIYQNGAIEISGKSLVGCTRKN